MKETYDQKEKRLEWIWKRLVLKILMCILFNSYLEKREEIYNEAQKYLKETE